MRQIKFRAWYKTGGRMITVGDPNKYAQLESLAELFRMASLNDYKLMQYTGIKDKNGKEIYEGDIVQRKGYRGVIEYRTERMKFVFKELDDNPRVINDQRQYLDEIEIIGNIYENKELLDD